MSTAEMLDAEERIATPLGAKRRLPGVEGVWVFILIDMGFFAVLFLSFVQERAKDVASFHEAQQAMHVGIGLVNMVVLLTSSAFAVTAVQAARAMDPARARRMLFAAAGCGGIFIVLKVLEYTLEVSGTNSLDSPFFLFYFVMTGIHFSHVIIGVLVLLLLGRKQSGNDRTGTDIRWLESGVTFWHMVDLLWVMIFPLLYLAGHS